MLCMAIAAISLGRSRAVDAPPPMIVAELDGAIHPISAEYLVAAMDRADAAGAAALIVTLRTPGGVLDSTRTIVSRMIAARTPIVVYVGAERGACRVGGLPHHARGRRGGDGARHAHRRGASRVGVGGEEVNKTMAEKAASDVAAYARSLAQARQRNVTLAEEAVLKSRSFTEREAVEASPPLIDLVAGRASNDLHRRSWMVARSRASTARARRFAPPGAAREQVEMTRRQRFLSAIAHPQIAYLLFTLGMLGLTVELWNPGSVLPGVVGGVCLLLAFLAFQVLPIDIAGLLLIVFGIGLLVLEIKIPSFGALGVGGAISLILGSIVLMGNTRGPPRRPAARSSRRCRRSRRSSCSSAAWR